MSKLLSTLLATAVRPQSPLADKARAVALNAAERGPITGNESAARDRLNAWLDEPAGGVGVLWGAPGSGKTALLARWLPDAAARGCDVVWVPLHRVAGLGTERAALAQLCAALDDETEPHLRYARDPEELWTACVRALRYDRDPDEGDPPLLVVVDGLHEAAGWPAARRFEAVKPGARVKLLLTDHGPAPDARAHNIALDGPIPEGMRQVLAGPRGLRAQEPTYAAEVHVLRALAAAPHPVPFRLLKSLEPGGAAAQLAATPVCLSDDQGRVQLAHGAYRALLIDVAGPFDETGARAELGEACIADISAADDSNTRSLLADMVGEEWPSLEGAALLLDLSWLSARWVVRGQVFDALMDVRHARAAAIGALARDVHGGACPRAVDALRIVAESAVLKAVITSLARRGDLGRTLAKGLKSGALARALRDAHARGASASMEVARKARAGRRRPSWERPWPSLGEIRDQLDRDAAEGAWGRSLVALVGAGREAEALDALANLDKLPFMRACAALGAAAALPGHAAMEQAARAAVDAVSPENLSAVVSVVPGAVCAVLGIEAAFSMASQGPEYQRVESLVALLLHLPTEADRRRAAGGAFAAWTALPPEDDAEGAILPAVEWLSNAEALSVLDRLLASRRGFTVKALLSPSDPSGIIEHLPIFHKLGGAPALAAAWDSLAKVARAVMPRKRR